MAAKKKTDSTKKREYKLPLFDMLAALDAKDRNFFDRLDDDAKKEFTAFMAQRWFTSLDHDEPGLSEYHMQAAAERSNRLISNIPKGHEKLQYLLLTTLSPYPIKGLRRQLLKPIKRVSGEEKRVNALIEIYPSAKTQDLEVMLQLMSDEEFRQLLDDHNVKIKDD